MKYRKMSADADYVFGPGSTFLRDSPEAVAQAVQTRLALFTGEWFLDNREGLDRDQILGVGTQRTRDFEVRQRILGTPGVLSILAYESQVDVARGFKVSATINTIYGAAIITETI
jgi:hypothetical protein